MPLSGFVNHRSVLAIGRKIGLGLVIWAVLTGCKVASQSDGPQQKPTAAVTDDRLVVALVPTELAAENVRRAADSAGYRLIRTTDLEALGLEMLSFELPRGVTGAQAIVYLETAEPNSTVGVNHAYYLQQSNGLASRVDYANALLDWPTGGCRAMAPVGLIDSGVDATAQPLAGATVIRRRFAQGEPPETRHGTEVASVLAHPTRLHDARIYNADVIGATENAGQSAGAASLIRAIDWLAGEGVRVINLSLAGPYNKLLNLAVNTAADRGLLLIAAVGNAGPAAEPQFPAGFEPVIAVTAVDANRGLYRNAGQGGHVDLAAPGVDVFVSSGESGRFVTGTSIAAPFVTARILADATLVEMPPRRAFGALAVGEGGAAPIDRLGYPG